MFPLAAGDVPATSPSSQGLLVERAMQSPDVAGYSKHLFFKCCVNQPCLVCKAADGLCSCVFIKPCCPKRPREHLSDAVCAVTALGQRALQFWFLNFRANPSLVSTNSIGFSDFSFPGAGFELRKMLSGKY